MNYIKAIFVISPWKEFCADLLIAELADVGFESFETESNVVNAYIQEKDFNSAKVDELPIIKDKPYATIKYSTELIPRRNWNEKWESEFQPVIINEDCIVRAPFHNPEKKYLYDIIIQPKMSFGTGHHETTAVIADEILQNNLNNKTVADCGCGTGILSVIASLKGASSVFAFDIDDWAEENARENFILNNVKNITVKQGGFELIFGQKFDILIANINRNILLENMSHMADSLNKNGILIMSGIYLDDLPQIKSCAEDFYLKYVSYKEKRNWISCTFTK